MASRIRNGVERYGSDVIRWTIGAIILVSAIIGLLFITRGTAVKRVLAVGVDPTAALVVSQVVLSFGIAFALVPLLRLTGDAALMGADVNGAPVRWAARVAVAVVVALADDAPRGTSYRVDVAGGTLSVVWTEDDRVLLTGPAVLVAEGLTDL